MTTTDGAIRNFTMAHLRVSKWWYNKRLKQFVCSCCCQLLCYRLNRWLCVYSHQWNNKDCLQTRNLKVDVWVIIYHYIIIEMNDGAILQFVLIKWYGVYRNQWIITQHHIKIVSRSGCDAHTDPIFKELRFLKMKGIHLLQLGQFKCTLLVLVISLLNLTLFSLLIIVFIVTTQGTLPFFGFLSAGQT